ncbi:MAG TPA: glycosyltransferase family 4 protein [Bryobacteraceae bacterium]|jgi:glycosyltransferase involved in cell wall biosynthesis
MKRVLTTTDTVGGVWTFTLDLAEALGRYGIEIVLASMGGLPTMDQREEAARIPNLQLLESDFKLEWMDAPWSDVAAAGAWLLNLEQSVAPDLVHLNSYGHGALPWSSPVLLTGHSCVLSWWAAVKREPLPLCWGRYAVTVARALQSVNIVTAPSCAMLAQLEKNYGALPHARVILNGRNPSRFRRGPKEALIFGAGRLWDEAKNVGALARIASSLEWPVCLAGDAGGLDFPGCRTLGKLSARSMAEWYARATIYALPARYEPFGLTVLEAALSGCALVLGDIPSLREVWRDAALYVSPDDEPALKHALQALIRDAPQRAALAELACERAQELTAERMANEYLALYREALRNRGLRDKARREAKVLCA